MDRSYGAVVFRRSDAEYQFLLVQHEHNRHWDMPKGHAEKDETPQEAALREIQEETNYRVRLIEGFSEDIHYVLPRGEAKRVTFYLGESLGEGTMEIDRNEIRDVRWFSFEDAREMITYENSRQVLTAAGVFLEKSRIYFEIDIKDLQSVAYWAAENAERALFLYERDRDDDRPRKATEAALAFARTGKRTNRLRKIAMDAHRASTEAKDNPAASAAAKAASLAAASAYTHPFRDKDQAVHILGPAAYSALAIETGNENDPQKGDREISRAVEKAGKEIQNLLENYPERTEGKTEIDRLLYRLDRDIRNKS
ncbi:MAG: NUDIX domain-containing protein [Spirochaetales bacterium]|nr:NUDIX domain-containing protein [Spirochaetales bacterium]